MTTNQSDVTLKTAVKQVRSEIMRLFAILVLFLGLLIAGSFAILAQTKPVFSQISDFHDLVFAPHKLANNQAMGAHIVKSIQQALFTPVRLTDESHAHTAAERVSAMLANMTALLSRTLESKDEFVQSEQFQDSWLRRSIHAEQTRLDTANVTSQAHSCAASTLSLHSRLSEEDIARVVDAAATLFRTQHRIDYEAIVRLANRVFLSANPAWTLLQSVSEVRTLFEVIRHDSDAQIARATEVMREFIDTLITAVSEIERESQTESHSSSNNLDFNKCALSTSTRTPLTFISTKHGNNLVSKLNMSINS